MKCQNIMLKKFKYVLILLLVILMCMALPSFATDVNDVSGENGTTSSTTNLPYIEMQVKSVKVGTSNQVLVECWASNLTNLEGLDVVFTYDNTILEPSYISGSNVNETLSNLESIKYDKKPTTSEGETAFRIASTNLLKNSFAFDSAYENVLGVDIFEYRAPNNNKEAMLFAISRKDYLTDVNATDPVLIGTFSFRQKDGTTVNDGTFSTQRIKVICDDDPTASDLSAYIREEANGEDCTEIIEFTYQKYGSISGTIAINVKNTKNIATIKVFEKGKTMDWTDLKNYKSNRLKLPTADYEYTTVEADKGIFSIDKIPYGEYEILIDKENYLDYIITNVVIDNSNKDIDLNSLIGNIELLPGDFNKDGKITLLDKTAFDKGYKMKPKDSTLEMNDDGKLTLTDKTIFDTLYKKTPKDNRILVTL